MADPLKLATTAPVSTSSPMTTLGGQLGQALGGGLQQLAANRLQRLQQQQQVSGLANLIGGDQQLAANILSQPPEIQKQILGSGGFRTLAEQGLQQGQGLDLFTPATDELKLRQVQAKEAQAEAAKDLAQQKIKTSETKDTQTYTDNFYKEYIKPLVTSSESLRIENRDLSSVIENAKKNKGYKLLQFKDAALNILAKQDNILGDLAESMKSGDATAIQKALANLTVGAKERFGGRVTNFELDQFMKRFPNPQDYLNPDNVIPILEGLIKVNESFIQKSNLAREYFKANKNKKDEQGFYLLSPDSLNDYLDQIYQTPLEQLNTKSLRSEESKKKNDLTEQVAQEQTMQPVQPQEQPVTTQIQPQQPEVTPQEQPQEQPEATQQEPNFLLEGLKPIDEGLRFQRNTIAQVLQPLITGVGGNVEKIADYVQEKFGEGNISAVANLAKKIIPNEQQAGEYLKMMGVPDEQIENPSNLVKTLQGAGIAIPLGIAAYANPLGTLLFGLLQAGASKLIPATAYDVTKALGGSEKAAEAAEGGASLFSDFIVPKFVQKLTKKILTPREKTKKAQKQLEKIAEGSDTTILENNKQINDLKNDQKKQIETIKRDFNKQIYEQKNNINEQIENLQNNSKKQINDLRTGKQEIKIERAETIEKIGKEYQELLPLLEENQNITLSNDDRKKLVEKLKQTQLDAFFPNKDKVGSLIEKYNVLPPKTIETGVLDPSGKPLTTQVQQGETRTLGDLMEDIKNLFYLGKGSKKGSPIFEAREYAKKILEKNGTPEFIDAKKQLDNKYAPAKKQITEIPIKKAQVSLQKQINNIENNTKTEITRLNKTLKENIFNLQELETEQISNAEKTFNEQIKAKENFNEVLKIAQKLSKSGQKETSFSLPETMLAMVQPKYVLGKKAVGALLNATKLSPATKDQLKFLGEYFPDELKALETAIEKSLVSPLTANLNELARQNKNINNILSKYFK